MHIRLSILCSVKSCFFLSLTCLCLAGAPTGYSVKADDSIRRDATVRAIEQAMPSVVNIRTEILLERRDFYYDLLWDFFGPYYRRRPAESTFSLGSGVVIHASGYVLTNAHVISRASRIEVILQDGKRYVAEPVAGIRSSDIALLRIVSDVPLPAFKSIQFADEDDLLLGETVLALGNPYGLGSSVSRGILSSKNRRPPMEDEPLKIEDWLQTDAAINPGNSGGPLINLEGKMVGLNVAVFREGQGIGFAIPVKRVNEAISDIMTPEILDGLWFGAKINPGQPPLTVKEVIPSSPAAVTGLRAGDAILRIDGQEITDMIVFHQLLTASKGESPVDIQIDRDGKKRTFRLQLKPEKDFFNAPLIQQRTGLLLQEMTPQLARHLRLDTLQGTIVAEVEKDSSAARAGIKTGFVVMKVNDHRVTDLVNLAKYIHGLKTGEKVRLELIVQSSLGRFVTLNRATATFNLR